jgi:hypothetical protein
VGISRLKQSLGRSTLFTDQSATGFVYFKKPKSKDATIVIVLSPDQGRPITVQIGRVGDTGGSPAMSEVFSSAGNCSLQESKISRVAI